jgi:hypothetical protein
MQVIRLAVIIPAKTNLQRDDHEENTITEAAFFQQHKFHNRRRRFRGQWVSGIDVHKKNCHIAVRLNGALALTFVAPSDNIAIARMMGKLNPALKKIACEAGPTGLSLARVLEEASLPAPLMKPIRHQQHTRPPKPNTFRANPKPRISPNYRTARHIQFITHTCPLPARRDSSHPIK